MKSWKLQNGYIISQVLSGRSNVYLISTPTGNLLIDTGKKNKRKQLLLNIEKAGASAIDWLLITHTHFDHCENAAFLQARFNCKIACSEVAKPWIKNGVTPLPKHSFIYPIFLLKLATKFSKSVSAYEPFATDTTIDKHKPMNLPEFDIQLIPTPGHSSDSICIVVGNEIILAGDTLFGVFPKSVLPAFYNHKPTLVASWEKLLHLNINLFLPGHGKPVERNLLETEWKKYSHQ